MEFLLVLAFFGVLALLIYSPAIYWHIMASISEKRFQIELLALENSGLYDQCRMVVPEPLGIGEEPAGNISFADAMKNQKFAILSTMSLMKDLEE